MVDGACLLVVLIGRLGRQGAGLVGMLNEVPAAVKHEFDPPAVQCKSQAPPDLLEKMDLHIPWPMSKNWRCSSASGEAIRSMMTRNALGSSAHAPAKRPWT